LIDRDKISEALVESQKFITKYPDHKYFNDVKDIKDRIESKLSVKP